MEAVLGEDFDRGPDDPIANRLFVLGADAGHGLLTEKE
jgi:hypothetical protein